MSDTFLAGSDITVEVEFTDAEGVAVTPTTASYSLLDEDDVALETDVAIVPAGTTHQLTITAVNNTLEPEAIRGHRLIQVKFDDGNGLSLKAFIGYVLESGVALAAGNNSFDTFGRLMIEGQSFTDLDALWGEPHNGQLRALIAAHANIGNVPILLNGFRSTDDMGGADIAALDEKEKRALRRAQLLEADSLLGGTPVEDRRRQGLMSASTGEVSQFFRTSKPLDLPVCREAMRALSPYVSYKKQVARG